MRHRVDRRLALIIVVAVLLRVVVAVYLGDIVDAPPLLTDQRSYHALGSRMVAGHGFTFAKPWYPFTPADTPTAHWSFLYSLFVAGVYAVFGAHPLAVRLLQAVLGGVLMPWAVYALARRIFTAGLAKNVPAQGEPSKVSRAIPLAAAAASAAYGYFMLYAATLMTETFFIVAVLWTLERSLAVVHLLQDGERVPWSVCVQLSLSLGVATLLRQSILPWVPLLALVLAWEGLRNRLWKEVVRLGLTIGAVLALFVLPWTYRNYRAYDRFLLLNSNTGYAMYSAQHPIHGTSFSEFEAAPLPESISWGNEAAMDSELMKLGIEFIVEDPLRYALLSLSRIRAFVEFWPTPDTTLLHNLGRVGSFGLALPFVIYGLVRLVGNRQLLRRNLLLPLFVLFYSVMHILTWAMVRYRLPVDAVLMPFVGWALAELAARIGNVSPAARRSIAKLGIRPDGVGG